MRRLSPRSRLTVAGRHRSALRGAWSDSGLIDSALALLGDWALRQGLVNSLVRVSPLTLGEVSLPRPLAPQLAPSSLPEAVFTLTLFLGLVGLSLLLLS